MKFSALKQQAALFHWIDGQSREMLTLVKRLAGINSYTFNLSGLKMLTEEIADALQIFSEDVQFLDLPPIEKITSKGTREFHSLGKAIKLKKRPSADKQVLLMIHMDTVYPPDQHFPLAEKEENILHGPGVADAKGGLVVMLKVLEALERSSLKDAVGWTLFINPDEEIGSCGSRPILKELALQSQIGLLFEPCLANGHLVGARKGSGNFTVIVRGRAAHAGRDYHQGRNAITALAKLVLEIDALRNRYPQLIVNIGRMEGGQAVNVVPDTAIANINFRVDTLDDQILCEKNLKEIMINFSHLDGISVELQGEFSAPPKILTGSTLNLYHSMKQCGEEMGLQIDWEKSGGVSDGNRLSAWGLPNVDTLGVRGDRIHSPDEYLFIDSLTERTKLTTLFLLQWAAGNLENI